MNSTQHTLAHGATDVGCVRSGNEDCFIIQEMGKKEELLNPGTLFEIEGSRDLFAAVSDGMGGAAAGEVASQTALTSLTAYVNEHLDSLNNATPDELVNLIEEGVQEANRAIYQKAQELKGSRGMGATITACYLKENNLYLFQVGDSRAYVLRQDRLFQVTRDQSFVGHLVEMGTITEEQAMRHPQRNVILQALGSQERMKVDISYLPVCKGDLVLVCSDGLHGEFLPVQFERRVLEASGNDIRSCVNDMVEQAKEAGGRDNITLIGLQIGEEAPEQEPGEKPRYMAYAELDRDNPLDRSRSVFR